MVPWHVVQGNTEAHSLHRKICVSPNVRTALGASAEQDCFVQRPPPPPLPKGPTLHDGDVQSAAPTRARDPAVMPGFPSPPLPLLQLLPQRRQPPLC